MLVVYLLTLVQGIAKRKNLFRLTLWMVDKCGDPEIGDFGDQFWPLLKEWLTEFVVFLFYFEDLLTGLLIQPVEEKKKLYMSILKA